jgi:basic amino acid/polyamine antiporter, APA family
MISALGAINGMILAGSHVYATVGEDHRIFAWLAKCKAKLAAPLAALVAQAGISLLLILAVGTAVGRNAIDAALNAFALPGLPWDEYFGGFETLVTGTAPVFWGFFLLTGISLFVLRRRDPGRERPFAAPWYPLTPIVFCGTCAYMLYSSVAYAKLLALLGVVPLAVGMPLYVVARCINGRRPSRSGR